MSATITKEQVQKHCDTIVRKWVKGCVSGTVSALAASEEAQKALDIDQDELTAICQKAYVCPGSDQALLWQDGEEFCYYRLEERYTPSQWEELENDFNNHELEPSGRHHLTDFESNEYSTPMDDFSEFVSKTFKLEVQDDFDCLTSDEEYDEAYEHWIIDPDLQYWFDKAGCDEMVGEPLPDRLTIWGRCTTGQMISMDGCIREVVAAILTANPSYFD